MTPFSCSSRIANESLSLHGDPGKVIIGNGIQGQKHFETARITHRSGNTEVFRIQQTTDLGQIAISVHKVV